MQRNKIFWHASCLYRSVGKEAERSSPKEEQQHRQQKKKTADC